MSEIERELKLFISYSHVDEKPHIDNFRKHIQPLKDNGLIKDWYDRKITAGSEFQDDIKNNLNNADIICLFISADFLNSDECKKEIKTALKLKEQKGIVIVPIILSCCGWKENRDISKLLALPIDGRPIENFSNKNVAWQEVCNKLKLCIEKESKIKKSSIKGDFQKFLDDSEIFTNAHSNKTSISITDIYVEPDLIKYNDLGDFNKTINSSVLYKDFLRDNKILISGENQAGKTTLCKILFQKLKELNFFPVYLKGKSSAFRWKISNKIENAFKEQYTTEYNEIFIDKIIPIIDDFHLTKNKEDLINKLKTFDMQILIVDDIFSLNIKDENLTKDFQKYKIKELSPTLRDRLIKKWLQLKDTKTQASCNDNNFYQNLDEKTELVDTTLGKVLSSGIMPSYPFFILSILITYETQKPLDKDITSQGYCYQALIYVSLRKQGVENDQVDTYINFLSEIAFYFLQEKIEEITPNNLELFLNNYEATYNLHITIEVILQKLNEANIFSKNTCGNSYFFYPYFYYFFVAKYLAENLDKNKKNIDKIINNLHNNQNAYITIFISHHSKNDYVLDEIVLNAMVSFDKYEPATLSKQDISFFDKKINQTIELALPDKNSTPENTRLQELQNKDLLEENQNLSAHSKDSNLENENHSEDLATNLRKSIKTVEVMGRIIKNRSGSLEKKRLEEIFENAVSVHFRILAYFFDLIKSDKSQQEIIDFIITRLSRISERKQIVATEKLKELGEKIFWNLNFGIVYSFIDKIISSIGSNNLLKITKETCDKINSPASFLVKHGIIMRYGKNLQTNDIYKKVLEKEFSRTAIQIIKYLIVDHCSTHNIRFSEQQKIAKKLTIPIRNLKGTI